MTRHGSERQLAGIVGELKTLSYSYWMGQSFPMDITREVDGELFQVGVDLIETTAEWLHLFVEVSGETLSADVSVFVHSDPSHAPEVQTRRS